MSPVQKTKRNKLGSDITAAIGVRLRTIRMGRGVSQQQLGNHLGLTFQQVQKYERGTNRISLPMAVHAARFLNTTVAELVGDEQERIDASKFDYNAYLLATALARLYDLSPVVGQRFRDLIEDVADNIEAARQRR
jgi:transcriptional regulator with XRE-family HTH domain